MKFVYPEFLYALTAIAIPIIVHLFNFRKFKKVYFSNVSFLKEVKQDTQSKAKIKHLLVLLSRILAISFLVFAFAQPFIPLNKSNISTQKNIVSIYIDNSFSMESKNEKGNLLDEAKMKAIEIVKSYKNTDQFIINTTGFSAVDQRKLTNEQAIDKIEEINISSKTKLLSEVYSRNRDFLTTEETINKSLYVISDFQKTITDFKQISADSSINTFLVHVKANRPSNLYIDTCWFTSPTHLLFQQEQLQAIVKNDSENDLENIPVKLYINNKVVTPSNVSVKANGETLITLNYQNKSKGIQQGKIELRDSPVTTDDIFYFSYNISDNIDVLNIHNKTNTGDLKSIYQTDSIFSFYEANVNKLDHSLIKKSNLVIINNLDKIKSGLSNSLKSFINDGGSLLILPSEEIDITNYNNFMNLLSINNFISIDTGATNVREINYDHSIFKNVFESVTDKLLNLPLVKKHYILSNNKTSFRNEVLTLKNGRPFLMEYKVGMGTVYLSSVGLSENFSNLTNHAIFVPTFYNMALLSQTNYPLFHTIGTNSTIDINLLEKGSTFHIKNEEFDLIPKVRHKNNGTTVFINSGVEFAGNYHLNNNSTTIGLAYNYSRSESKLSCFTVSELEKMVNSTHLNANIVDTKNSTIVSTLNEINIGKQYWKICIILALFFLAIEIILLKVFK